MAGLKPSSIAWLDQLKILRTYPPNTGRTQLKKALNLGNSQISDLQTIAPCFDQAAEEKVRMAAKADPPFILSANSALALAGLAKAELADLPTTVHTALDIILSRRLTTSQIEALVDWLAKGHSADSFMESAQPRRAPRLEASAQLPENFQEPPVGRKIKVDKPANYKNQPALSGTPEDLQKVLELSEKIKAEIARGDGQTIYQDELITLLGHRTAKTQEGEDSDKSQKKKSKSASAHQPNWFWEFMVGISFFKQLRSKVKKGEDLTLSEQILVGAYRLYDWVFKPIGKRVGKFFKWVGKGIWGSLKKAFGKVFGKTVEILLPWLVVIGLVWGILAFFHFAVSSWHWIENKIESVFHHEQTRSSTPVPTPLPAVSTILPSIPPVAARWIPPKKRAAPTAAPVLVYQPAVSFQPSVEDPKVLELEIAALHNNVVVKDFPVSPDEGMPGDVAVSRMQDISDQDKYTLMIGGDRQIILSLNTNTTGLTINHKSADPFSGLWGGNGPINFLWEDVKAIHVSEIDIETKTPSVIYQFTAVISDSKYPLTIQCSTADNLKHLVSAVEYFIHNSRLGHDTALGGMPYPSQGLRLNNDRVVEKLWADSPADKAGLQLGDHLWSVGKATSDPQEKKIVEKGLSALPVTLFVASPAEWTKAKIAQGPESNAFHPRLKKIVLSQ